MAKGGGLALKGVQLFMRFIEFCCASIILGIYAYFLAALANNHLPIETYLRAVTGISGAGVLYTLIALVLVCCLGGIAIWSIIAIVLDVAFAGAFIYLAYATRHGANSCSGIVNTPLGIGNADGSDHVNNGEDRFVNLPKFRTACKLNTACFAVSIIGLVFFCISIFVEIALMKHHKKQKAYGPSPANNYTSGAPKRKFWQRKNKHATRDVESNPDALPAHATPVDVRDSYNTESTAVGHEPTYNKYSNEPVASGGLGHRNTNPAAPQVYGGPNTAQGYQTTTTTDVPHRGHHQNANF
ncbi:hypothetical protein BJ875DRAFT_486397 [Amylocarpus encephaloides]|uniref:MARVEL domain-containing protein n=1 Tax=Amylocarpus encephaloides TaxID=45428 RepID=A0A9P8C3I8_9HELO|nr:hypothetical protein BJ875DRAFT_486397 [Amylocarpus encephaloides]